jgi:hypothetical protein
MAAFEPDADLTHPLDYRLVHNSFVTLFWDREVLDETTSSLSEHGYDIVVVDAAGWADEGDMHRDLAATLNFPDYYGHNLHALNDCLRDVAAARYGVDPGVTGLALVVLNYDGFTGARPQLAHSLLDIFATQARAAALIGRRMMCLVQSNDPKIRFEPVGATPVIWNPAEWLDSSRSV